MKMARILFIAGALGGMCVSGLSEGEPPAKGAEPRKHDAEAPKKSNDAGKQAAGQQDSEEGRPPKAREKKNVVHPGQPRLKPAKPVPSSVAEKKLRGDHARAAASPGSGAALPQQAKKAPQVVKPAFEVRKTDGRPGQTASATGPGVINGTSMNAMRHGGGGPASIGGVTGSTAKGAAAVNGTDIKRKP
jgi:hypothetical protein